MKHIITIWIPGIPKAQPRPRAFARKFGDKYQARVYDCGITLYSNYVKPYYDGMRNTHQQNQLNWSGELATGNTQGTFPTGDDSEASREENRDSRVATERVAIGSANAGRDRADDQSGDGRSGIKGYRNSQVEEWKPVVGYEGLYDVSSLGRVRRSFGCRRLGNISPGRIMCPAGKRYPHLWLSRDGEAVTFTVHKLVATAFLGPCPKDLQINHIDGNTFNPAASNLEYVTQSENMQHAVANGLYPFGDRNGSRTKPESRPRGERSAVAKLTDERVRQIRADRATGLTLTAISVRHGVCFQSIYNVCAGLTWRHVK